MAILLADVGGTNARLAIARNGVIDEQTVTRFRGDDYSSFDDVVTQFLQEQDNPRITSVSVAVAGPVSGGVAELTNRDWDFSEDRLARLTDADQVRLLNDLTALGYATPSLTGDGLGILREAPADRHRNGQSLVVGAGTGFNVCAVKVLPGGKIVCLEAEEGHTYVPDIIMDRLRDELGDKSDQFFSVEETFAGRGLSRLHALRTDAAPMRSELIAEAAAQGDPQADATYRLFAEMFGLMCRELALRFMPMDGMFLAGSVGRSLSNRLDLLVPAFLSDDQMRRIPENVPMLLIKDDMAALQGCLAALD